MPTYHVALKKIIDVEVEADDEEQAKSTAISEYSDGAYNDQFDNAMVQVEWAGECRD